MDRNKSIIVIALCIMLAAGIWIYRITKPIDLWISSNGKQVVVQRWYGGDEEILPILAKQAIPQNGAIGFRVTIPVIEWRSE